MNNSMFRMLVLLLVIGTAPKGVQAGGKIVVAHDINTLSSSLAGVQEQAFAVNVASFLTADSPTKNILLFEFNPTDSTRDFAAGVENALNTAGFSVTVTNNYLMPLTGIDAIFVAQKYPGGNVLDNNALIQYIDNGGGVYLAGGVNLTAAAEAAAWQTFLNHYGLAFNNSGYNGLYGDVPITSAHPIFAGITGTALRCGNGQSIIDLGSNPNAEIVQFAAVGLTMQGVYAVVQVAICGDGAIDPGEQCDDGNTANGDCCSSTCQYETSGSPCPADGNPCTVDTCDGAGSCGQLPTGCKDPGKSLLLLKNNASDDTKDKLVWKWLKGEETSFESLGVPTGTTNYTLCLYSGANSAAVALPAGSNWQPAGSKGYKYKDKSGTPDGAQKALLKSGDAGKAKALVKGKGTNLPDTLVPMLPLPVTAQLVNDTNSTCFEATYNTAIKNDAKQFKAKTP